MSGLGTGIRVLARYGAREFSRRAVRRLSDRIGAAAPEIALHDADIADSGQLDLRVPSTRPRQGSPLTIGWVLTPPGPGSGGHTTLFRMVAAAEAAGHRCILFLTDYYGGDRTRHERVIRQWWPQLRAEVRSADDGIVGLDAAVASSWETAHVLATRGTGPMRRLYFIQDYEPWFHPRGAASALAEDSYRFGFRCIALGETVARALREEVGVASEVVTFGCDTSVYRLTPGATREGVVAFARPGVARRGWELTRLALARFHAMRPEVTIHTYGDRLPDLPFAATQHGRLTPAELNDLYARCVAGVAMSFTNITLVADEMLAAGVVPVIGDNEYARAGLAGAAVAWARPTPGGIAQELAAVLDRPDREAQARHASTTARPDGWARAQAEVLRIIEDEVHGDVLDVVPAEAVAP
ncbi:glycosyltransferase family 1 protein [Microbacterium sp. JZ31]|uniref:glycosyltransferase family 1 protein n=1 Tax=Microbacterium sp. JZ31 TaxID=1906274 RepID=UPI0019337AFA|nr:glycosyltransferase family 1 protein [Microbacterium sp. JZ31]